MDSLGFVASLVGSLAWPAAIALLAWWFRSEVKVLLRRPLRRAKVGIVEAEWDNAPELFAEGVPRLVATGEVVRPREVTSGSASRFDGTPRDAPPPIDKATDHAGDELVARMRNAATPEELAELVVEYVRQRTGTAALLEAIRDSKHRIVGANDQLEVEPESASALAEIGDALLRDPKAGRDQLADYVTAVTTMAAGLLLRGVVAQRAGNVSIALRRALGSGSAKICLTIETPGVGFAEMPHLNWNTAAGGQASAHLESDTVLVIDVEGPSASPLVLTASNIRLSVALDAPLGAVRMSVSFGGSKSHAIASIATVVESSSP